MAFRDNPRHGYTKWEGKLRNQNLLVTMPGKERLAKTNSLRQHLARKDVKPCLFYNQKSVFHTAHITM